MSLYGKEKIYWLVNRIKDQIEITEGNIIGLDPVKDIGDRYDRYELSSVLGKLEKAKAIKFIDTPNDQNYMRYQIRVLSGFSNYLDNLMQDPKYLEWSGVEVPSKETHAQPITDGSGLVITYTPAREIILNNQFLLARPNLAGENDLVFKYLYENPNLSHSKSKIEGAINIKITKPLTKIVENLGFKADLNKAFFSVSKTSIEFRNPVPKTTLDLLDLNRIKI